MAHALNQLTLLALLLTQTACVGAVVAAANAHETRDRQALKQWLPKIVPAPAGCENPIMVGTIIYHDFDLDTRDELVVNAARCGSDTGEADINLVLTADGGGNFVSWPIAPLSKKQIEAAKVVGATHYRLRVEDGVLMAIWSGKTKQAVAPMVVRYRREGAGFAIDKVNYPH